MKPDDVIYWFDDITDEVNPCQPTLEGWATFLAAPGEGYHWVKPAQPGDTYPAHRVEIYVVTARYDYIEGWSHLPPPEAAKTFVPCETAPRMMWDADEMQDTFQGVLDAEVENMTVGGELAEPTFQIEIACLVEVPVRMRFDLVDGKPTVAEEATVQ